MLMYVFPLIFAFSGVNFPIGVLIYWTTTNLWSMGQQFYTIRKMPAPGSQAEKALKARQARKAAHKGLTIEESEALTIEEQRPVGQRQQPVGKARAKKRPTGTAPSAAAAPKDTTPAAATPVDDAPAVPAPGTAGAPAGGKKKRSGSGGGAGTGGATGGRPGAKPAGSKPAGPKSSGSKPSGAKPSGPADD
jgi:YidC/Oxa1 family membrane protein insertase